jgi:hypothetical protein
MHSCEQNRCVFALAGLVNDTFPHTKQQISTFCLPAGHPLFLNASYLHSELQYFGIVSFA